MPAFKFRNSTTGGAAPVNGDLIHGELALNIADRRAFQGTASATTEKIIDSVASQSTSNVNITGGNIEVTNIGNSNAASVRASTVTLGGTNLANIAENLSTDTNKLPTQRAINDAVENKRGRLKNIYTFTGTGTYVKSGPDVQRLHVICVGGGGGGRAYSECGGAGGYSERVIDATSITSVSVTVGGAGAGGVYFGFSGGGGTTSFGGFVSASGGTGANAHIQHHGGTGGFGSGGNVNAFGGGGGGHNNMDQYSGNCAPGGLGGISFFGGGTPSAHSSGAQPADVAAFGAGGVAISPSHNGQGGRNGRSGMCIIYEYK
jgi:hypothetical protein